MSGITQSNCFKLNKATFVNAFGFHDSEFSIKCYHPNPVNAGTNSARGKAPRVTVVDHENHPECERLLNIYKVWTQDNNFRNFLGSVPALSGQLIALLRCKDLCCIKDSQIESQSYRIGIATRAFFEFFCMGPLCYCVDMSCYCCNGLGPIGGILTRSAPPPAPSNTPREIKTPREKDAVPKIKFLAPPLIMSPKTQSYLSEPSPTSSSSATTQNSSLLPVTTPSVVARPNTPSSTATTPSIAATATTPVTTVITTTPSFVASNPSIAATATTPVTTVITTTPSIPITTNAYFNTTIASFALNSNTLLPSTNKKPLSPIMESRTNK